MVTPVRPARTGATVAAGLLAVLVGVLVLRAPGAQPQIGWFSYDGPPSPQLLDSLLVWNLARAVGALLVLLGLLVLARLLGSSVRRRGGAALVPLARGLLVLAGLLVLGGLVAFALEATVKRRGGLVGGQITVSPAVWTQGQAGAALVVAVGLLVGAAGTGRRG